MTDVTSAPEATTDAEMVSGVAQYLEPVVIDLNALALEGKQAHWHVRGRNFIGVHELLDTLVEHAREYGDTAADADQVQIDTTRHRHSHVIPPIPVHFIAVRALFLIDQRTYFLAK